MFKKRKVIITKGDGFAGDEYEPQSYFSMAIFESENSFVQSVMYDFRPEKQVGPINVLSFEGVGGLIQLQCWVES